MNLGITRTACAFGMAAALTFGSQLAAQQTAADSAAMRDSVMRDSLMRDSTARARRVTSSQRIPVRKDAMRQDTTMSTGAVARDTVVRDTTPVVRDTMPADTATAVVVAPVPTPPPADTVRTDTVAVVTTEPVADVLVGRGMFGNGFYIGIGGGGTVPMGDLSDGYDPGFNVTVPIGWQSMTTPWGIRADLAYNRIRGAVAEFDDGEVELDDGDIWSGTLGLTAQWPVGASSTSFYLVGGGGAYHFRDFGELNASGTEVTIESENVTKFGLNGGLGINFAVGAADIFVDARYVSVFTEGDKTNFIPITLGVRFF